MKFRELQGAPRIARFASVKSSLSARWREAFQLFMPVLGVHLQRARHPGRGGRALSLYGMAAEPDDCRRRHVVFQYLSAGEQPPFEASVIDWLQASGFGLQACLAPGQKPSQAGSPEPGA